MLHYTSGFFFQLLNVHFCENFDNFQVKMTNTHTNDEMTNIYTHTHTHTITEEKKHNSYDYILQN